LALSPEELVEKLGEYSGPVLMGGDGLAPYRKYFQESLGQRFLAAGPERLFLAPSAAIQGLSLLAEGKTLTSRELRPVYLRLSEAEEKRLQQQAAKTEEA